MKRFIVACAALFLAQASIAAEKDTVDRYNRSCIACHASGAAGAPIAFRAEVWAPRLEKGMATLVKNSVSGINAMPPKGMCFDCTDEDFEALINYMSAPK